MSRTVRILRVLIAPLTRTRPFRWLAPRAMPPVERMLGVVTRGRVQLSGILVPSLVLHSTGARSGIERDTVLMYTADSEGRAIIAGTSFAREKHPAWTYNLMANPSAAVSIAGVREAVHATRIADEERNAVWELIEAQWPGYRAYERESGRTVRLFRLTVPGDGA